MGEVQSTLVSNRSWGSWGAIIVGSALACVTLERKTESILRQICWSVIINSWDVTGWKLKLKECLHEKQASWQVHEARISHMNKPTLPLWIPCCTPQGVQPDMHAVIEWSEIQTPVAGTPPIDAGCDVTWSIFPLEVAVIYFCHPLRQKHHSRLFAQGMGRGALMAKLDIEAAYHTVSAHPQYHLLLGVQCHDFIHIDGCLPFGLWSALKIFTAIAALATFVTLGPKWPSHTTANSQGCCINPSDPRVSQLVWVVVDTRRQRLIVSLVPEGVSLDWILQTLQMGGLNWKSISWLDQISIGISSLKKTGHGTSGPVAIDTRLGWVLSGLTSSPS